MKQIEEIEFEVWKHKPVLHTTGNKIRYRMSFLVYFSLSHYLLIDQ